VRDQQRMAALGREHRHLQPLVEMGAKVQRIEQELAETRELLRSDDPEMAAEATAEEARLESALEEVLAAIKPARDLCSRSIPHVHALCRGPPLAR
jgi:protein subunit release factor A